MTETTKNGEAADAAFLWAQAESYKMHFPQLLDAGKSLYKFAKGGTIGLPFQIAVDLRTMTVVHTQSGAITAAEIVEMAEETLSK